MQAAAERHLSPQTHNIISGKTKTKNKRNTQPKVI
jgi:hypothetical protein